MLLPAVLGVGLPACLLHHYNFPTLPLSILISLLCNLIFLLAFFEPVNHRSVWFKPMLNISLPFRLCSVQPTSSLSRPCPNLSEEKHQ